MKLPKKVVVMGITYDVTLVPEEEIKACGEVDFLKQTIKINKTLKQDMRELTCLHEILHIVLNLLNVKLGGKYITNEETLVEMMDEPLYAALKDNGLWRK